VTELGRGDRFKLAARQRIPTTYEAVWRTQRKFAYRGTAVCCPICDRTFGRWEVPEGEAWRHICPLCHAEARHRSLWLWLPTTDLLARRHSLLHFAPEWLIQAKLRALPNLDYISADLTSPLADRTVDITEIPFADNSFDIIFCSHVLHYIPDDRRAMSELYRVLRPGGWALLLVPYRADRDTDEDPSAPPEERLIRFGAEEHLRSYGKDYLDRLRAAGFDVENERINDRFDPSIVRYFGLYADEAWIIGRKR